MTIRSKFEGRCTACGGAVHAGDSVEWVKGVKGVKHSSCPANPEPAPVRMASASQIHWINVCLADREVKDETRQALTDRMTAGTLTFDVAHKALDALFKLPHAGGNELPDESVVPAGRYALENGDGTYRLVKVWRKNGHVNVYDIDQYGKKHPIRTLHEIAEVGALESAQLYGRLRHECSRCGTVLRQRLSVHIGLGTGCVEYYPNGKALKAQGRQELRDMGLDPYETPRSTEAVAA